MWVSISSLDTYELQHHWPHSISLPSSHLLLLSQKIDSTGALINTSKNQRKLRIIENEFAYAKAEESDLRQEEETVRSIVRKKKFGKIQESRKFDKIMIMKQGKQNQRRIKAALNEFLIK